MSGDWCLITDIDGTVIGERDSTLALRQAVLMERSALLRRNQRLHWVIATGRRYQSARSVLLEQGFAPDDFDAVVTAVGAELYLGRDENPHSGYHAHLDESGFEHAAVLSALRDLEFLEPQPGAEQFAHKVSYWLSDTPEHRQQIAQALARLPFQTQLVFSHGEYLDVTPVSGAKGGAVAYLLERWRIPTGRAVAAGDSGNDASMLERDWHGIVVGNGRRQLEYLGQRPNLYFAGGHFAAGVHEGLLKLGFLTQTSGY